MLCVPGSFSELVANAEANLPRRLELREVGAARLPEVGVQHREGRLRIRVVVERRLLVEEIEHVGGTTTRLALCKRNR
jgi:hypothetical protein